MDDWLILFRRALAIMDAAPPGTIPGDWTVGGGTMLFRRYRHQTSRDIGIKPRLRDVLRRLDTARDVLRAGFAGVAAISYQPSFDEAERVVRAFIAGSDPAASDVADGTRPLPVGRRTPPRG